MGLVACLAFLLFMNLRAFAAFRRDKLLSETGGWRIPERRLLRLAFLGGWVGAKLAQRRFRHKTTKEPFRTRLNRIPACWLVLAALLILAPADLKRGAADGWAEMVARLTPRESVVTMLKLDRWDMSLPDWSVSSRAVPKYFQRN